MSIFVAFFWTRLMNRCLNVQPEAYLQQFLDLFLGVRQRNGFGFSYISLRNTGYTGLIVTDSARVGDHVVSYATVAVDNSYPDWSVAFPCRSHLTVECNCVRYAA